MPFINKPLIEVLTFQKLEKPDSISKKYQYLILAFSLFMSAFLLANDTKAHRILFIIMLVIPGLFLFGKELISNLKDKNLIFLSFLTLFPVISLIWLPISDTDRPDKLLINSLSTFLFVNIAYLYFTKLKWQLPLVIFSITTLVILIISFFIFIQEYSFPQDRFRILTKNLHPNATGYYAVLSASVLLFLSTAKKQHINKRITITALVFVSFLLITIFLTQSRGSMVAALVVCTVFLWSLKPFFLFLSPVLFILSAFILWLSQPILIESLFIRESAGRNKITSILIERVGDQWLTGLGPFANETLQSANGVWAVHAHSIYLSTFYHFGLIGLSLLFIAIILGFYCSYKIFRQENNFLPFTLMSMGTVLFFFEGTLFIRPYYMEWLFLWLPISLSIALHKNQNAYNNSIMETNLNFS